MAGRPFQDGAGGAGAPKATAGQATPTPSLPTPSPPTPSPRGPRPRKPVPATPPTAASLQEAALAHLARFSSTEAALRRVLQRRVDRWARAVLEQGAEAEATAHAAAGARQHAATVAQRLAATGVVDDAAFAAARAARLHRAGRSRRAIAAHLATKGVEANTAEAALPGGGTAELDAALACCRRRRLGPFARAPRDEALHDASYGDDEAGTEADRRALAALARAGFTRDVAEAALAMAPEEAEERLLAFRRG